MYRYYLLLIILTFSQCASKYNNAIDTALNDVNSKQVDDLEAVLNHYIAPQDSLKRKAAYFLVENFPEDKYQTIDKQLLIENIDLAFEAWKKPWAKQLSFDEFKELVLPFDLERDSTGTFWRKRFMNEFSFVEDSLKSYPNENPTIAACIIINKAMQDKHLIKWGETTPISFNEWEKLKTGDCVAIANFTNNVMHSIGIPTSIEFTPQWANLTNKHFWNIVFAQNHFYPFTGAESNPRKCKVEVYDEYLPLIRKRPKVFRITYAVNPLSLASQTDEDIPNIFDNVHIHDVSKAVLFTQNIVLSLPDSINDSYLYLSNFSRKIINGIDWGKRDKSKVQFLNIRPETVYILSTYKNRKFSPINYPFILKKNGDKHYLKPQLSSLQTITCYTKFPVDYTNFVKIGDKYELLYWNLSGWQSLGTKMATQKTISFDNVPKQALLILANLTRGKQEHIFTYENNKQVFW